MEHTTRNKFLVAVAAGVITCGGAIATATVSNADPSTPTSTSTAPSSTSATDSTRAHLTIAPVAWDLGGDRVKVGFRYDGTVFAGAEPMQYTSSETLIDGKIVSGGDGGLLGPDARIRQVHGTWISRSDVDGSEVFRLAPGQHTLTVHLGYPTGPGPHDYADITVSTRFTVGSGGTSTSSAPPSPSGSDDGDSTNQGEPPTPSPKTTQLGVTG